MKLFLKTSFILVLAALFQPCPAPFIPLIIAGAAEAAIDAAAEIAADAASAAGEAKRALTADDAAVAAVDFSEQQKRASEQEYPSALFGRSMPTKDEMKACWQEVLKNAPQVVVHNSSSITLTGLHECWTGAIKSSTG